MTPHKGFEESSASGCHELPSNRAREGRHTTHEIEHSGGWHRHEAVLASYSANSVRQGRSTDSFNTQQMQP